MRVEVKNWHGAYATRLSVWNRFLTCGLCVCACAAAVASWTWTSEDDVCGICHMALDGCAPGAPGPGDDSPVVWGRVRRLPSVAGRPCAQRTPALSTRALGVRSVRTTFTSCASTRGCTTRTPAPSAAASGSSPVHRSRRQPRRVARPRCHPQRPTATSTESGAGARCCASARAPLVMESLT